MLYPAAFVLCVCLSAVSPWYVRKLANARGWIHEPKLDRHLHTIPVPRLGGVAIYFSFMSVVILAMALPYFFGKAVSGRHSGVYLTVIFLLFPFDCEGKLAPRFW
jgi:UDP-N-acetylmuramyl pentapeptide phosphotransferase/UDP-N-acetylglucosamine-1-phosphate transferase